MNKFTSNSLPFGVYQISKNYIDHLRKTEPRILSSEKTTTYCGPVAQMTGEKGSLDLFVPIDVDFYNANDAFALTFIDGVLGGIMNFMVMVPCLRDNCVLDESNEDLTVFCRNNERLIKKCANIIRS